MRRRAKKIPHNIQYTYIMNLKVANVYSWQRTNMDFEISKNTAKV